MLYGTPLDTPGLRLVLINNLELDNLSPFPNEGRVAWAVLGCGGQTVVAMI